MGNKHSVYRSTAEMVQIIEVSALFGVRHDHPKRGGWVDHKEHLLLNASPSALLGPALEGLAWGIKTSQHHNGIEDQARREIT